MHAVQKNKTNSSSDSTVTALICITLQTNIAKNLSLKYWHRHQNSQRAKRILKSFLLISLSFVLIPLAMKHSQAIEVDENFFAYRQRDLECKRNRAKSARAKKAQI